MSLGFITEYSRMRIRAENTNIFRRTGQTKIAIMRGRKHSVRECHIAYCTAPKFRGSRERALDSLLVFLQNRN